MLNGAEAGHGQVVALSGRQAPSATSKRVADIQGSASAAIHCFGLQFTLADHAALAAWASDTSHGYGRLTVERGLSEDGTWARYALVYAPGQAWSIWGVMRRGDLVEVWRCATGQTVSRHARMTDALTSLPHATDQHRALREVAST